MRSIFETDGLSRAQRLEKASAPVMLPVLEERFSVLLARALGSSDFTSIYQFQSLVVLLEIEQFDTYQAETAFHGLQNEEDFAPVVFSLITRMNNWKKRLEYDALSSFSTRLLKDLAGQISTNISPQFSLFFRLFGKYMEEKPDIFWFASTSKEPAEDNDKELPQRLYLLLLSAIRLLQSHRDRYREDLYATGHMDPSLAVLVAFLNNYGEVVSSFNRRWQSLPLLYLKELLKAAPRQSIPGTTWLTFEKSPGDSRPLIPRGTFLPATSDETIAGYKLLSDIQLTDMQPLKIHRIIARKDSVRYPEAALGYVTAILQSDRTGDSYTPSPIGVRIHSSLFQLSEGSREVNLLFRLTTASLTAIDNTIDAIARIQDISRDEAQFKILYDAFYLQLSTSEGEQPVERFHIRLQKGIGLLLVFRLAEDFPAIVPLEGETLPSLRLLMNPGAWLFPYSWACNLFISSVNIRVSVQGLRNFQLYNELGTVDSRQPFAPFGLQGDRGAWFAFSSSEMANKPIEEVAFTFNWQKLPNCVGGLKEYYQSYNQGIDNSSFQGRIDQLHHRVWKPLSTTAPCYLFRTSDKSPVPEKAEALTDRTTLRFEVTPGEAHSGSYRLVLTSPEIGFGNHEYRRLFAEAMMYNSHKNKKAPLPSTPLSLLMDAPQLSYTAQEEYCFTVGSTPDIHFSYIRPLSEGVLQSPDTTQPIPLIEGPRDEGNLMIGIAHATGENLIQLYFDMELLQREIDHRFLPSTDWYYRDAFRWKQIAPMQVLRDDTGRLMHSGAVVLQLPFCITDEMTDDDGLFWICVAVHENLQNCSSVRDIYLNVAEVEPVSTAEEVPFIPGLAAYRPVVPVTGNRAEETDVEMRTRLSERIAHRHRLLLPHEYEQMTLQEFPEIAKAKCLPGIDQKGTNRGTIITLAVVRARLAGEYPLCTDELLCRVEERLRQYASPFVEIDAINPVYEEVTVFCGVSLKEGIAAGTAIKDIYHRLRTCIAPWEEGNQPPVFGYSFSLHDMLSQLKEGGKVSEVHGLKLLKVVHTNNGQYCLCEYNSASDEKQLVSPSAPWAILVPAEQHYVNVQTADEWNRDIELGDFKIDNTFVIK